MSRSFNKVIMVGNLSADPEVRQTTLGKKVVRFRIAINDDYKDTKRTYFFNVVAWDRLGEIVQNYTEKGSKIMVEGRLTQREWEAVEDGKNVKRSSVEIVAENIVLLGSKNKGEVDYSKTDFTNRNVSKLDNKKASYSDILNSSKSRDDEFPEEDEGQSFEDEGENIDEELPEIDESSDLDDYKDFDESDKEFK